MTKEQEAGGLSLSGRKVRRGLIGALIGGLVGWLLYRFVGCSTGACPLMANPIIAVAIFGVAGLLVALPPSNEASPDDKPPD